MSSPVASAPGFPPLSIVITTFNHARFLAEAIESALAQTLPPAEVIVVDDGSTDAPESVVARYPSVHLIRQSNQGLAAARNAGLRASRGAFIAFLDADDRLRPEALRTNLDLFLASPACGFVYSAHCKIDATGATIWPIPLKEIGEDPYATMLSGNSIGMHATVLYRRDRLESVGAFDPALCACEDYDVYLRMSRLFPVVSSSAVIADYRQHASNMSRNSVMMLRAALKVLRRQKSFARTRPDWRDAYLQGLAGWKQYYASELVRSAFASRPFSPALALGVARMIWLAPLTTQHELRLIQREYQRHAP